MAMKILMVCLGNICRSPMAEGILRHIAHREKLDIITDSAGTSDYHVHEAPDRRAQAAMLAHGIDITDLRGRQLLPSDFTEFDLLLAMDASNLQHMIGIAPDAASAAKAKLIMDFAPDHPEREVPDPYYGGDQGFERVFEMLLAACTELSAHVRRAT
ncbi:MAG: low molecular weight protein-tyrosine-phosphatase [Flavobacteriales bacterium]